MNCPFCKATIASKIVKKQGRYRRSSDSRWIQRFFCKCCKKSYSHAYRNPAYYHKKRRVNDKLKRLLASSMSQRRAALLLHVSRTTVARKLRYLGALCRKQHQAYLNQNKRSVHRLQFDEAQTIEHTKCKPLSVAVVVSDEDRKILGIEVSSMPATGYLAAVSRKKYGYRPDRRREGLRRLFSRISDSVATSAYVKSDMHPYYEPEVRRFFPDSHYTQFKGKKAAVTGQGELKATRQDPLFCINHTLAMLRANINRLVRKTWCTTKDPERLADHLAIYMVVHNQMLTP